MKKQENRPVSAKKIIVFTVALSLIVLIPCLYIFISGYLKQYTYCETNIKYIDIHIRSLLEGKFDNGDAQKETNGEYFIDMSSSPNCTEIEYNNKKVKCIMLKDSEKDGYIATIGDIRGKYLKDKSLSDVPIYTLFPNNQIPICPFSTEDHIHYYCVLEDGTVICSHPQCQ